MKYTGVVLLIFKSLVTKISNLYGILSACEKYNTVKICQMEVLSDSYFQHNYRYYVNSVSTGVILVLIFPQYSEYGHFSRSKNHEAYSKECTVKNMAIHSGILN